MFKGNPKANATFPKLGLSTPRYQGRNRMDNYFADVMREAKKLFEKENKPVYIWLYKNSWAMHTIVDAEGRDHDLVYDGKTELHPTIWGRK